MQLNALIENLTGKVRLIGDPQTEIKSLCSDSRKIKPGALFFCIPGLHVDGHDFAPRVVEQGAAALIVQRPLPLDVPQVIVEDVRAATSRIAVEFYGRPAEKMTMIGLTGTKGKTTTSYLIKSIFESAGLKTGLIGTVCCMLGDEVRPATLTTPDPIDLQALLAEMAAAGCKCVVMEVSAHAIYMSRLAGVCFDVGTFTNFSQDHLDYFGTMDAYFDAKMRFFEPDMTKAVVYNADDERVARGMEGNGREALRIGIQERGGLCAEDIRIDEFGCSFAMAMQDGFCKPIRLQLSGIFNVYNALMAAGACLSVGIAPEAVCEGLERIRSVPGRIELLDTNTPYRVILDYAHAPDALENILRAVRETTRGRLIALFGCGGDRDAAKRPIMGEIGGRLADFCVLTSDNPRSEDPMLILDAIEAGIRPTNCPYIVIENRREAIRAALKMAKSGDAIVLAGKGHEPYQEIRGVKHSFDEKTVVAELLRETEM